MQIFYLSDYYTYIGIIALISIIVFVIYYFYINRPRISSKILLFRANNYVELRKVKEEQDGILKDKQRQFIIVSDPYVMKQKNKYLRLYLVKENEKKTFKIEGIVPLKEHQEIDILSKALDEQVVQQLTHGLSQSIFNTMSIIYIIMGIMAGIILQVAFKLIPYSVGG